MSDDKDNVGKRKAEEAAAKAKAAAVIPLQPGDWNDVHRTAGADVVKSSVLAALNKNAPHVSQPDEFSDAAQLLWERGLPPGDKTGWPSVSKLYTVVPGMVTVITGWPGSGKSEFLDALMVDLAKSDDWKFVIHSPENQPTELHLVKLVEKVVGKPFGAGPTERVSELELRRSIRQLNKNFAFILPPDESGSISAQDIVAAAAPVLKQWGPKRGLVIDPWNELEHWRPAGMSETEYVSMTLSMLRNWARATKTHVWIVAHPQKIKRESNGLLPVPRPDMISGSQHWWNKADACITVDRRTADSREVDIHVQKMRFKHLGQIGMATLLYDRVTGRYEDDYVRNF